MSTKVLLIIATIVMIFTCSRGFAQAHVEDHHDFKHHRVAVIIGHGHVIGAEDIFGKSIVTIPTWGFDYQYWINERVGFGLKGDIEIMEYVIESAEGAEFVRQNPYIISTVFLYKPKKQWYLLGGPGIEIEENHNLFILRMGTGYEFELPGHWDFSPEVLFDLKDGRIGAFTWGIGVGKRF